MGIGDNVKARREELGLTQEELVKLCGGEVEAKDYLYSTLDEYRQFTRILLDEDGTFCRIDKDGNYID